MLFYQLNPREIEQDDWSVLLNSYAIFHFLATKFFYMLHLLHNSKLSPA